MRENHDANQIYVTHSVADSTCGAICQLTSKILTDPHDNVPLSGMRSVVVVVVVLGEIGGGGGGSSGC